MVQLRFMDLGGGVISVFEQGGPMFLNKAEIKKKYNLLL
jgi:hypothetical protein